MQGWLAVKEHDVAVLHVPLHDISDLQVFGELLSNVLQEQFLHETVASVEPHLATENS